MMILDLYNFETGGGGDDDDNGLMDGLEFEQDFLNWIKKRKEKKRQKGLSYIYILYMYIVFLYY